VVLATLIRTKFCIGLGCRRSSKRRTWMPKNCSAYSKLRAQFWKNGPRDCGREMGSFRKKSRHFETIWRYTVDMGNRARTAVRKCSEFAMQRTRRTTVRAVKQVASCWPTARFLVYSRKTGPERSMNLSEEVRPGDNTALGTHDRPCRYGCVLRCG
jgi:hypothetical protein